MVSLVPPPFLNPIICAIFYCKCFFSAFSLKRFNYNNGKEIKKKEKPRKLEIKEVLIFTVDKGQEAGFRSDVAN